MPKNVNTSDFKLNMHIYEYRDGHGIRGICRIHSKYLELEYALKHAEKVENICLKIRAKCMFLYAENAHMYNTNEAIWDTGKAAAEYALGIMIARRR
jgi:hypothetical protein